MKDGIKEKMTVCIKKGGQRDQARHLQANILS